MNTSCLLLPGQHVESLPFVPKLFGWPGVLGEPYRQGNTHPPPVPLPFLLKCVRGSLEASFSSSVHSRSHSSSVYTSPDWREEKLVQEAISVICPHPPTFQRQCTKPPRLA